MPEATKIPRRRLAGYLDAFTKRFPRDGAPEAISIEVLAPEWGDRYAVEGTRLLGITYDTHTNELEFSLENGDRRIYQPQEVWAVEEADGFISTLEVVRPDGVREIITVKRVGPRPIKGAAS